MAACILIVLKLVHIYTPFAPAANLQKVSEQQVAAADKGESLFFSSQPETKPKLKTDSEPTFNLEKERREIERQKAELKALSDSIDQKLKALKEAENNVLELLEDTQSNER